MSAFVISKKSTDEYKFEFSSRKGKTIFRSLPYELKFECEEGIELFKSKVSECQYIKQKASNGKYFFNIFLDDELFAISRKYSTELRIEKGIEEIKKYASTSEILDFSDQNFIFDQI